MATEDDKVVRWCLNALARLGQRHECSTYINATLQKYEGNPEITAAGVAALSRMYQGDLTEFPILGTVDPVMRVLAALQTTDPAKLDLASIKINIDTSDPEVLKLALITVGLNRDIENLLHPRHSNGEIIKALGQYPDSIVRQYCVWSVIENEKLSIFDLGIPYDALSNEPPNVQSKLLQLAAEQEPDQKLRHEIIMQGTYLPMVVAREGLAKGLRYQFYDGLQGVTIDWFDVESNDEVKGLIAEHFGRYSTESPTYREKALVIAEAQPSFLRRLLLGAEGKPLYGELKSSYTREGMADLFATQHRDLATIFQRRGDQRKPMKTVLVLAASPIGQKPLRLDAEARDLKEQLDLVKKPAVDINVEHRWAVRADQIQSEILNVTPHVIHFSGHGNSSSLCFEDRSGKARPVSSKAIEELFKVCGLIECVVLSACHSKGIAASVSSHVKVVIGCDGSINDDAASAFARAFYRALAHGKTYQEAFALAQNDVRVNGWDVEADKFILNTCA